MMRQRSKSPLKRLIRRWRTSLLRVGLLRSFTEATPDLETDVLVIAPHPDDETFGCGGLMALARQAGARVHVVFLTDGEAAHRNCCGISEEAVAAKRREHALEALEILGVDPENTSWLRLPDGRIPTKEQPEFAEAVNRLGELIRTLKPQRVYVPHPLDGWPDHIAATQLTLQALTRNLKSKIRNPKSQIPNPKSQIHYYPVWLWHSLQFRHFPRVLRQTHRRLDIRPVLHQKRKAIEAYFAETVPACGAPYCGRLPEGFVGNFLRREEFFFVAATEAQRH